MFSVKWTIIFPFVKTFTAGRGLQYFHEHNVGRGLGFWFCWFIYLTEEENYLIFAQGIR